MNLLDEFKPVLKIKRQCIGNCAMYRVLLAVGYTKEELQSVYGIHQPLISLIPIGAESEINSFLDGKLEIFNALLQQVGFDAMRYTLQQWFAGLEKDGRYMDYSLMDSSWENVKKSVIPLVLNPEVKFEYV
ncbi:Uncharacterised protein [Vibrio cholerae]|nr:Uncharacterised protein [Vibrio cholerae]